MTKHYISFAICFLLILSSRLGVAQFNACDCTASVPTNTTVNFSTLTWTGTGCPTSGTTSTSKNLCVDLANGSNLVMDQTSFSITGTSDFKLTNNGSSTFTIPSGSSLTVGGDLGDNTNNNTTFVINGGLNVGGTIYGKNSNGFSGSGSVTAGGLNFNQEPSGGTGITWTVPPGNCQPSGSTFCTTVTPVTLISFSASKQKSHVGLNWATATEFNFDYFDIERSQNGTNFISIGKVEGHGTTNERQDYQFVDELPFVGKNYYRLKSVDFDLYTETFDVIAVDFAGEKQFHLSPNPSDGNSIAARINFVPSENASVIVYDNVGSIVGKFELTGNESGFTFSNQLKSGVYYAKFSSDGFSKVSRFLVRE